MKIIVAITLNVKFMFELAILYIIFNMATSDINKMSKHNKKKLVVDVANNLANIMDIASALPYF